MTIHDQRPRGGCSNCGNEVRSRKGGQWLCGECAYSSSSPHWDANGTGDFHMHDQRLACPIGSDDALIRKIKRGAIRP